MLNKDAPLTVPGTDLLAFADLDSIDVIWVVPGAPRLALAADGQADVSIMLYRRGPTGPIEGGQLTLGLDLALTDAERTAAAAVVRQRQDVARVKEETKARLRATVQSPGGQPAQPPPQAIAVGEPHGSAKVLPPPDVRTMNWLSADYSVELVPGLVLAGRGSLMGTNNAIVVTALDPGTGPEVEKAWANGLPDCVAQATVTVEAATQSSAAGSTTTSSTSYVESTSTGDTDPEFHSHTSSQSGYQDTHVGARIRRAEPLDLLLRGPLTVPSAARTSRRTEISL